MSRRFRLVSKAPPLQSSVMAVQLSTPATSGKPCVEAHTLDILEFGIWNHPKLEGIAPCCETVTVAEAEADPPAPVQLKLKVVVLAKAPVDCVPEVAMAPDQPPEAVQDVAFVEDHVRVEDP